MNKQKISDELREEIRILREIGAKGKLIKADFFEITGSNYFLPFIDRYQGSIPGATSLTKEERQNIRKILDGRGTAKDVAVVEFLSKALEFNRATIQQPS